MRHLLATLIILSACATATVPTDRLPACADVGCPGAPGPTPGNTDGAGLYCEAEHADDRTAPCFCVPAGPGVDRWCRLER